MEAALKALMQGATPDALLAAAAAMQQLQQTQIAPAPSSGGSSSGAGSAAASGSQPTGGAQPHSSAAGPAVPVSVSPSRPLAQDGRLPWGKSSVWSRLLQGRHQGQ
eukprot:1054459-Pyramimonas_sp.AAC.1